MQKIGLLKFKTSTKPTSLCSVHNRIFKVTKELRSLSMNGYELTAIECTDGQTTHKLTTEKFKFIQPVCVLPKTQFEINITNELIGKPTTPVHIELKQGPFNLYALIPQIKKTPIKLNVLNLQ